MFGREAHFNRDQVNLASIFLLMQLVQVVDAMREGQRSIMEALDCITPVGSYSAMLTMDRRRAMMRLTFSAVSGSELAAMRVYQRLSRIVTKTNYVP